MSLKILFLGGSSYLGREIIKSLNGRFELSAVVRSEEAKEKILCAEKNVQIYFDQDEILDSYDLVFNLIVDYGRKDNSYDSLYSANVTYPLNLFGKIKTKRIFNFSTALGEEVSNYSATKIALERKLLELAKIKSIAITNFKLQHFFGPSAPSENFISFLIESMMNNVNQLDLTDGEQMRDFLYIDDLLGAIQVLINSIGKLNEIDSVEVGSGVTHKVKDVVMKIKELTESKTQLNFGAKARRPNEPELLKADNGFLLSLGWKPRTNLELGLKQTISGFAEKIQ